MKDILITDFTTKAFEDAFMLYFKELGHEVKEWNALFHEMNQDGNYGFVRLTDMEEVVGFIQIQPIEVSSWFFTTK